MKFHVLIYWQVMILSMQFWKYIMYFWYSVVLDCFSSVWLCASGFVHMMVQGALCVCTCTISFCSSFVNKMGGKKPLLWNDWSETRHHNHFPKQSNACGMMKCGAIICLDSSPLKDLSCMHQHIRCLLNLMCIWFLIIYFPGQTIYFSLTLLIKLKQIKSSRPFAFVIWLGV